MPKKAKKHSKAPEKRLKTTQKCPQTTKNNSTIVTPPHLSSALVIKGENVFPFPRLALPHKEGSMAVQTLLEHGGRRVRSRKHTVEPRVIFQLRVELHHVQGGNWNQINDV